MLFGYSDKIAEVMETVGWEQRMNFIAANLGVSTADAEDVQFHYQKGVLSLVFLDWQKQHCEVIFEDVLGFQWQDLDEQEFDMPDDQAYEVVESQWLGRQAQLQDVPCEPYAHYKLCFNSCGCLDVLAKRKDV